MQPRLPSLRSIETFIAAAETTSFRLAALRLNVTVSAVSHRISALEAEVGMELFHREGRGLKLTRDGKAYYERLLPGLDALRQAVNFRPALDDDSTLKVATFPLFFAHWLAPRLKSFITQHPKARIEVGTIGAQNDSPPDVIIGTATEARIKTKILEGCHKLIDWDITPVCHPDLIKHYEIEEPADLVRAPLIDYASVIDAWPRWFEHAGVPIHDHKGFIVLDSLALQYDAAYLGMGVGLSASCWIDDLLNRGLVQPFPIYCKLSGGAYIGVVEKPPRPIANAFRSWVIDEMRATVEAASTFADDISLVPVTP